MKLTQEQSKIIDEFPEDGTDWDGVHEEVMLKILDDHQNAKKWSEIIKIGFMDWRIRLDDAVEKVNNMFEVKEIMGKLPSLDEDDC